MLWVSGDSKGLFLESLLLQEVRHTCPVGRGDGWKHTVCSVEVTTHHSCLVLKHRNKELIGYHIKLFVTKVEPILFWDVAKEIESPRNGKENINVEQIQKHSAVQQILPIFYL